MLNEPTNEKLTALRLHGMRAAWEEQHTQAQSSAWASTLEYLSVFRHYDDFTRGVIDTSNLIFYLSFIVVGIFLTVRSIDSMRWRRA